jgi:predicted CoA-binding protein
VKWIAGQVKADAMEIDTEERERLLAIYRKTHTIAVVGASADPGKAAYRIPKYLQQKGYRIIPVNPRGGEIFGEAVYSSLLDVHEPIDVVDVFRPAAEAPEIARQSAAIGASVLWLQLGIVSEEARQIASGAGLQVVMDRCMGATHAALGLGPGPD